MIKTGVWLVVDVGNKYEYRVCTPARSNREWTIFKKRREPVGDPEDASPDGPPWELVETGYKSKASAVEMVIELAAKENFNPVADHLNNIDDGVDLNNEGGY
jgi:hypothetical protein